MSLCGNAWNHSFSIFDLMEAIGCSQRLIAFYQARRSPAHRDAFSGAVAKNSVDLEAGKFIGLDAMWRTNGLDKFKRSSPFGINIVPSQKLYMGAQGRTVGFNADTLADALSLFDKTVLNDKKTPFDAKRLAFS